MSLKGLTWQTNESGKATASLKLAAACLTAERGIAASRLEAVTAESPTDDVSLRAKYITRVAVTLRVPTDTASVRVVLQEVQGGRLGSVDIDPKTLDAAPATPTPEPTLTERK